MEPTTGTTRTEGQRRTHGFRWLNRDLRHADVRLVEVLDGPGGILGRLVANIANAALGDDLDVGDLAVAGREVLPGLCLSDGGGQPLDEYP